jgi:uncharacterized protein (TIGR03437 family)
MTKHPHPNLNRRRTLALLGGVGAAILIPQSGEQLLDAAIACTAATPQVTEGPYWVEEKLFRSDIRTDPTTGVARQGVPLTFTVNIQNTSGSTCVPLAGAYVDVWHCDAIGIYSDEPTYNPGGGTGNVNTSGQKFLRGYQISDDNGQVQFTTIYPGWYSGRTIHIHVRIRTYSGTTLLDGFVSQLFFDDAVTNQVLKLAPYNTRTTSRDTSNTNDMVYEGAPNPARMLMPLTQNSDGSYAGNVTLGVTMKTAAAATPAIATGGIVNGASGAAGLTPGSWITIYGANLAATTRALAGSDIVNNTLPTSLGGVSVQIDGKPAYVYYLSPTQINVLSPADSASGSVSVTVTNSVGTSSVVNAAMQALQPGLFLASGYVTAASAKAGDSIELFGTGFGASTYTGDAGAVFSGAYPATNNVTVKIGGVNAPVSFAGLVGPGLYQINVIVPTGLTLGDNAVVATVGGVSSQAGALLKVGG